MGYFKSWDGLKGLSETAKGNEKLGVGIRPYGLHAGNLASVVAYPYLFMEEFERRHQIFGANLKKARFTFQVWLNDIEPVTYIGADGTPQSADWANMYPQGTSFQFTPAPNEFQGSLVDYWQPAIEGIVRGTIGARFPYVKLEFRRASELAGTQEFEKMVIGCITRANKVKEKINRWNIGVAQVDGPSSFVWPLSPDTHAPIINPGIECENGEYYINVPEEFAHSSPVVKKQVGDLCWSMQFRMLHVARLAATQPDIWFMGMDHVPTSMGNLLRDLADLFNINRYQGHFLHSPLLFAGGNKKLSKSLGSAVYMSIEELIMALRGNPNVGLDVKFAPVSSDILSIGPKLLPKHIAGGNIARRRKAIEMEKAFYDRSGRSKTFLSANSHGAVSDRKVAVMLGVPHL